MLVSLRSFRRLTAHQSLFPIHFPPYLRDSSPLLLPTPISSSLCAAATAVAAPERANSSCGAIIRHSLDVGDVPVRYQYTDSCAATEFALNSVVKVFTVSCSPNYFLPWQKESQRESTGSGFVIPGHQILTNAHVVADHTFVLVRKHGSPTKYKAEVQAVGHECDLALLTVDNEQFWEGMSFLDLGEIPFLQESVVVVGYPQGGNTISVTKGVVSRVEPTRYAHAFVLLMAIQIDAAINPGNSGGPAIMGDKVVGVAFQNHPRAKNIGYSDWFPFEQFDKLPSYYIFAGLVFVPLTQPYLRAYGDDWYNTSPRQLLECAIREMPKQVGEQLVILCQVLMDDINTGYENLSDLQVKKVNGMEVQNLKHLCSLVECCHEESLRFDLDDERLIVLNYRNAKLATSRILQKHRIPSSMSADLIDEKSCSEAEAACSS